MFLEERAGVASDNLCSYENLNQNVPEKNLKKLPRKSFNLARKDFIGFLAYFPSRSLKKYSHQQSSSAQNLASLLITHFTTLDHRCSPFNEKNDYFYIKISC